MSDVTDMSTPVTRGELRDELAQLEARIERKVDDKLDGLERKLNNNMGLWGEALAAQIRQVAAQIAESEKRLLGELARHMQAGFESMTAQISAVDDKYKDLPARVARLEAHTFK
jgi:hypothetical protein